MRMVKFVLLACMVAMIAGSALAQMSVNPMERPISVLGVISAVSLEKSAIVLGPLNVNEVRPPVTIFVNEKTKFIKDGKAVGLDALSVGDRCRAMALKTQEGALLALGVWAYTPTPQPQYVKGVIEKIGYDTGVFSLKLPDTPLAPGRVMLFIAGSTTKIAKDGQPAVFTSLLAGDMAAVGFMPPPPTLTPVNEPIKALSIEARTPPQIVARVNGKIVGIDKANGIISVLPPAIANADGALKFRVTDRTVIDKFGKKLFEALCVGDMVDVAYNPQLDVAIPPAISITVLPLGYAGFVAKVDLLTGVVVAQQSPMGPAVAFKVVPETKILKNGQLATLKAIMARDQVEIRFFHFPDSNVAMLITAKSPVTR